MENERDISHEQVVEYDPKWPEMYEAEAEVLKPIFDERLLGIEHIGSTAIPGLASKPIVDIMVLIEHHKDAYSFVPALLENGYRYDGELNEDTEFPERHFFRKGMPSKYHLSIAYADKGGFWKRMLAFRDYLREHPEDRDRYGELKKKLIKEEGDYIAGKTDLVNEIIDKSGFTRWKPPEALVREELI